MISMTPAGTTLTPGSRSLSVSFFEIMNRGLDEKPSGRKETKTAAEFKARYHNHDIKDNEFILVSRFLSNLNRHADGEALIFDDNIIYMQRFFTISGSGGYFPNSGARFASGKPVIAILGDGGFQMCCMEIMTAVNYDIPLTVVLLNNSSLGLVRKNQFYNYNGRFISSEFSNPDYQKLAD